VLGSSEKDIPEHTPAVRVHRGDAGAVDRAGRRERRLVAELWQCGHERSLHVPVRGMPERTVHFQVDEFQDAQFHSDGTVFVSGNQASAGGVKEGSFFPGKVPGRIGLGG
jgi:hypothetical protein